VQESQISSSSNGQIAFTLGLTVTNAVEAMDAKTCLDVMSIGCTITVSQTQELIFVSSKIQQR
jgi:hypothetical protein